jgi:hypothetical protein
LLSGDADEVLHLVTPSAAIENCTGFKALQKIIAAAMLEMIVTSLPLSLSTIVE